MNTSALATVEFHLTDDDVFVLTPSSGAALAISQACGGPLAAIERLRGLDHATAALVIAAGANIKSKEGRDLPSRIYEEGKIGDACASAIEFCGLILSGGKREEVQPAGKPAGNGEKKG